MPVFAGRNLYVSIRDEELPGIVALNRALLSYMETLFRLAARGHWMREKRPVISLREPLIVGNQFRQWRFRDFGCRLLGSAMATYH